MHQSWRDFVTTGPADRHVALFYKRDEFVHRCVAIWAAAALTRREGVILVGTPSKCVGIRRELRAHGVDVDGHEAAGRLVVVDAEMLMAHFTVNGGIDGATFSELVTTIVARVREATGPGARRIRAWGEMVDLFCERAAPEKAAELESLWEQDRKSVV